MYTTNEGAIVLPWTVVRHCYVRLDSDEIALEQHQGRRVGKIQSSTISTSLGELSFPEEIYWWNKDIGVTGPEQA